MVLHRIGTRAEPLPAFGVDFRLGVMTCGNEIVVMATFLIEGTELNQSVAHHIGIRRQTRTHLLHRIGRHLIPVFLMTVDDFQLTAILMRHRRRHLQILLR